jgi:hypothetical protein
MFIVGTPFAFECSTDNIHQSERLRTMKATYRSIVPLLLFSAVFLVGCNDSNPAASSMSTSEMNSSSLEKAIAATAPSDISPEERASMIFMREEEKVARDVYITMYQRWGHRTFNNISRSEEVHMRAILILLSRYGIPDPVGTNGVGVFTDPHLQDLYNQLIALGNTSLLDALRVGVLIEETDIDDLEAGIALADNRDILLVYNNLMQASHNHLRAFNANIGQ